MVIPVLALLLLLAPADFVFNDAENVKAVYRTACEATGNEYVESNADACPGFVFEPQPRSN